MPRSVAFLRGINVGGRVVKKEVLKDAFTAIGLEGVETFRQSGNVVFESDSGAEATRAKIEPALRRALGYDVPVFVRTMADLRKLVEGDPFKGVEDGDFLVTFLPASFSRLPVVLPITIPKSKAKVLSSRGHEAFSVTHGGGEGALPNPFLESKLKVKTTTRNMNVIRAIVDRFGD